jgi:polysaccharide export outer membrane protein
MTNTGRGRGCVRILGLLALLASAVGCADPYRDVDLNTGQVVGDTADRPDSLSAAMADTGQTALGDVAVEPYRVTDGDVLEIVFFSHPEQNRFSLVRPDGRITLPYVGELVAAGRTTTELAAQLQASYAAVLVEPRVDVLLHQLGGRFYVLGEVRSPGEFPYERRITLLQALARSGGFTNEAQLTNFVLIRRRPDGKGGAAAILDFRRYMADPKKQGDIHLEPYDIVWVPRDKLSRWDNVAQKTLMHVVAAQDVVLRGYGLANFDEVYKGRIQTP